MKLLLTLTIVFFLLLNTHYFWSVYLGILDLFAILFLFMFFLFLTGLFLYQFIKSIREKFRTRQRNVLIICMILVLGLTVYKPSGLIPFSELQGTDLFIAEREGAANCMTTLRLKNRGNFIEERICFGAGRVTGTYRWKNDTVWFSKGSGYYAFGVMAFIAKHKCINLYKSRKDRNPLWLLVVKDDLKSL